MADAYKKNSITLPGAVAMGTGVMIGAGIFALTGQIAELAGPLFPLSFCRRCHRDRVQRLQLHQDVERLSVCGRHRDDPRRRPTGRRQWRQAPRSLWRCRWSSTKVSSPAPSALTRCGRFGGDADSILVPVLGVGLIVFAYLVNASGTRSVGLVVHRHGRAQGRRHRAVRCFRALGQRSVVRGDGWRRGCHRLRGIRRAVDPGFQGLHHDHEQRCRDHQAASKRRPGHHPVHRDLRRSSICLSPSRSAPACRSTASSRRRTTRLPKPPSPPSGKTGFYLTVALALVATASGLIASVFAVSRMLAMLTDMKMIPHSHFGMPGTIKDHTLVYTVVIAGFLTVFFDLSRIASLGAFFYLVMDMIIHSGRFPAPARGDRRAGLGAADGHRARRRGAGRLRRDEVAVRPPDRCARARRYGAGVPVRAGFPRAQSCQGRETRPPLKITIYSSYLRCGTTTESEGFTHHGPRSS